MGIINPDLFVFKNGGEKTNTYISFAGAFLLLTQDKVLLPVQPDTSVTLSNTGKYRVTASYNIYWNKQSRFLNKDPIEQGHINTVIEDPIPVNLYEYLYNLIKTSTFPNAIDSVENSVDESTPTV